MISWAAGEGFYCSAISRDRTVRRVSPSSTLLITPVDRQRVLPQEQMSVVRGAMTACAGDQAMQRGIERTLGIPKRFFCSTGELNFIFFKASLLFHSLVDQYASRVFIQKNQRCHNLKNGNGMYSKGEVVFVNTS